MTQGIPLWLVGMSAVCGQLTGGTVLVPLEWQQLRQWDWHQGNPRLCKLSQAQGRFHSLHQHLLLLPGVRAAPQWRTGRGLHTLTEQEQDAPCQLQSNFFPIQSLIYSIESKVLYLSQVNHRPVFQDCDAVGAGYWSKGHLTIPGCKSITVTYYYNDI